MLEHPAGLSAEEQVCCSAGPSVVAQGSLAHGHAWMPGSGQTRTHACSGRCLLSQKDSSLELILGHKSSGVLLGLNSGLKLHFLFTALLLVCIGNKEDKLFYTASSKLGV